MRTRTGWGWRWLGCGLLSIVPLVACQAAAPAAKEPPVETSEQRLWRTAKERLVSNARTLSPEAERLLGELIDKAAATVGSPSASPEDVERAAASIESLINAAVRSTEEDCPNCREVEIPEKSMRTALSRVCPLFPFC